MAENDEIKRLSCLEVWGGNQFVPTSVELPGMEAGLIALLQTIDASQPRRLSQQVIDALTRDGWQVHDDLTMLLFRPNGQRSRLPWPKRLLLPFRALQWGGRVIRDYSLGGSS